MIDHRSPGSERWKDPRCSPRCPRLRPIVDCVVFHLVRRPDHFKRRVIENAQRVSGGDFLNRPPPAVKLQVGAQPLSALRLAVALVDTIDAVEDLAVYRRAQQLQVFGMSPHQRNRRSRRLALFKTSGRSASSHTCSGIIWPSVAKRSYVSISGAGSLPGRQFIVSALACEQRPHPPLSPSLKRPAVGTLPVAVPVVPVPARPLRQIRLQHRIHHLQRIDHQRIIGAAYSIPHQLKKTRIDDLARFKFGARARRPVVDVDDLVPQLFAGIGFALLRRPDAHVVPLDLGQQHAVVGNRPVLEVALDPVGELLEEDGHLRRVVRSRHLCRANQAADHRRQRRRRIAGVLFPPLLVGDRRMLHQESRRPFDKRKYFHLTQRVGLPQPPRQNDGEGHLVQLLARPVRPPVHPEILSETSVRLLRAGQINQCAPRRFGTSAGQQRRRRLHHVPRPHQVIAAQVIVAVRLPPRNRSRSYKRAGKRLVFVRQQHVVAGPHQLAAVARLRRQPFGIGQPGAIAQ